MSHEDLMHLFAHLEHDWLLKKASWQLCCQARPFLRSHFKLYQKAFTTFYDGLTGLKAKQLFYWASCHLKELSPENYKNLQKWYPLFAYYTKEVSLATLFKELNRKKLSLMLYYSEDQELQLALSKHLRQDRQPIPKQGALINKTLSKWARRKKPKNNLLVNIGRLEEEWLFDDSLVLCQKLFPLQQASYLAPNKSFMPNRFQQWSILGKPHFYYPSNTSLISMWASWWHSLSWSVTRDLFNVEGQATYQGYQTAQEVVVNEYLFRFFLSCRPVVLTYGGRFLTDLRALSRQASQHFRALIKEQVFHGTMYAHYEDLKDKLIASQVPISLPADLTGPIDRQRLFLLLYPEKVREDLMNLIRAHHLYNVLSQKYDLDDYLLRQDWCKLARAIEANLKQAIALQEVSGPALERLDMYFYQLA